MPPGTGAMGHWWGWMMARLRRRTHVHEPDSDDREYDRKLGLMERRLDELGLAVEIMQHDDNPDIPWERPHLGQTAHPHPSQGPSA